MTIPNALERLEIREACERLALDYCYFADNQEMDEWSQLFAEDGALSLFGQTNVGPAAIRASIGAGRGPAALSVHAITNHRIDVLSEDEAKGTASIILFTGERKDGGPAAPPQINPAAVGTYHDAYKRTAAGWKFASRSFKPSIIPAQA
jgi:hypothetical protein